MGWLLLLPALALLLALTLYPVLYGAWLIAVRQALVLPGAELGGLRQLLYILQDGEFWASVWRGTVYAGTTIVLQIVLGLAAALVLNEMFPGRNLLRAIVIFPYVMPTVVAVILWKWLLNSQFGLINYMLEDAGLIDRPDLLDGARLDHGLADPGQRLAVLSLRGDRRAGAAADRSRTSSTRPRPSTAPTPGSASAMSRCRSSEACCS